MAIKAAVLVVFCGVLRVFLMWLFIRLFMLPMRFSATSSNDFHWKFFPSNQMAKLLLKYDFWISVSERRLGV